MFGIKSEMGHIIIPIKLTQNLWQAICFCSDIWAWYALCTVEITDPDLVFCSMFYLKT